jgi:hypothetical protein
LKPKEKKVVQTVTKIIKNKLTHYFSAHETEFIENSVPMTIIEQEFCKHGDFIMIYEVGTTIFSTAFRAVLGVE